MAFDVSILNGTVVDGSGRPGYKADVGVSDGRIAAIGALDRAESARRIDASGHVVVPGFIDMHSHSDRTLLHEPGAESRVHQGITTEVVGNCASTPFPVGPGGQASLDRSHVSDFEWDWTDLDGWADHLERGGISLNVAPQVGHAAIRIAAGAVDDRPPTADQLKEMRRLAAESVEQGAFSLTTGLTLPPSSYADADEIAALVEAIAPYEGAFYASHARVWAGNHVGAVEECVEVARRAGVAGAVLPHGDHRPARLWRRRAARRSHREGEGRGSGRRVRHVPVHRRRHPPPAARAGMGAGGRRRGDAGPAARPRHPQKGRRGRRRGILPRAPLGVGQAGARLHRHRCEQAPRRNDDSRGRRRAEQERRRDDVRPDRRGGQQGRRRGAQPRGGRHPLLPGTSSGDDRLRRQLRLADRSLRLRPAASTLLRDLPAGAGPLRPGAARRSDASRRPSTR